MQTSIQIFLSNFGINSTHHTCSFPRCSQNRINQIDCSGFSISSCHSYYFQFTLRITIPIRHHSCPSQTSIFHLKIGHGQTHFSFSHYHHRPFINCTFNKIMTIYKHTFISYKNISCLNFSRISFNPFNQQPTILTLSSHYTTQKIF